jgi:hypothetical protein
MKKISTFLICLVLVAGSAKKSQAQESSWTAGADLVSNYIWRGLKFGNGPALQPKVEFNSGIFTLGGWGSYCFSNNEAPETDLYMSLSSKSGLSLTFTDYYFPGTSYFKGDAHYFEPMLAFEKGNFKLLGAYMVGHETSDLYLEAGLAAGPVNLTMGAGEGQYSKNGKFNVCNIGIGTSKEIKITDSFSLPVSGSLILNPSSEQLYIVFAVSL